MQVFYDLDHLPDFHRSVVTIGSFDGIHRGHQQLLARIKRLAERIGGESVVVTFHPHPRLIVYPQDKSLRLLTTIEEKEQLLREFGIDHLVVVPFTVEFSQQSADEYIQEFLVGKFKPRFIVIGYDHRFGLNRQGDINYLKWYGPKAAYEVIEIEPQQIDDIAISSTKIRQALEGGEVARARRLLGYPYRLTGVVVHGKQIGRTLGFPTANLKVDAPHKLIPPDGIYAVRVAWGESRFDGMLYIGRRPSLEDENEISIEVHLFNVNLDLYDAKLQLQFYDFIRGDQAFKDLETLRLQMGRDQEAVQQRLAELPAASISAQPPTSTAIVILNFNGRDYLRRFLPALLQDLPTYCQVYVADNGSTDGSLAWLADHYPRLATIDLQENYGFAEGYNRALEQVSEDIYVLLNSDVEVSPGWLAPCLQAFQEDPLVAAVQPKIRAYHEPDYFEYAGAAGGWIDVLGYPFCRGRIFSVTEQDIGQYDSPQEVFWASGAALFVRAALFHRAGGFDGRFFAHAEEIDLCWRLKRAGYRILTIPASTVYHVGGGTLSYNTPRKAYLNFRNTLAMGLKNESVPKVWWWFPARLLLDGLAGLLFLVQGKWQHIGAIIQAHWTIIPKLGYWWRKRQVFNRRVEAMRVGPSRENFGRWNKSIVWNYYLLGKRFFTELWPRSTQDPLQ